MVSKRHAAGFSNQEADSRHVPAFLFAILAGVFTTFVHGYQFGLAANQIAELPVVLRRIDASYLTHDFYVNASDGSGPRFYFAQLIAVLSRIIPLPWLYLILACLTNAGLCLLTYFVALELSTGSILAAMLSSTLVLSVYSIGIGGGTADSGLSCHKVT